MIQGPTYNSEYLGSKHYHTYYYTETSPANPTGYGLFNTEKALFCGIAQTGVSTGTFRVCGLMAAGLLSPN